MAAPPSTPGPKRRVHLLATLGELIARNGAADFLCAPVQPGKEAFPEPWRATRGGVHALLRRLAWYADFDEHAIVVEDKRLGGRMPTQHFQETHVGLREVRRKELVFDLELLGDDDIGGTLAHELGVAFAALNPPEKTDPYRSAQPPSITVDPERDGERGSIATVYLGLGVLAANAAYQQHSSTKWSDGFPRLIHEVLRAGYVKMSDLAFLLAVQAIVRGEVKPPAGLSPPQRDEAGAWIEALATERSELCTQLGVDPAERGSSRGAVQAFTDIDLDEDVVRTAFRWHTSRGFLGMFAGTVAGMGAALVFPPSAAIAVVLGGSIAGIVAGRRVITTRCSGCATVVRRDAKTCAKCKAVLRGDIDRLADRLEAEERLQAAAGGGPRDRDDDGTIDDPATGDAAREDRTIDDAPPDDPTIDDDAHDDTHDEADTTKDDGAFRDDTAVTRSVPPADRND